MVDVNMICLKEGVPPGKYLQFVLGIFNYFNYLKYALESRWKWSFTTIFICRNIMEDESNIRLAYATHEDIAACCPAETVLAVRVREPCANFSIIIFFKM